MIKQPDLVAELTVDDLVDALPGSSRLRIMRRLVLNRWNEYAEFYILLDDDQLEALEQHRRETAAPPGHRPVKR